MAFTQRSVNYYWTTLAQHKWKHSNDPIESARAFLYANADDENLEVLEIEEEPNLRVIAFVITDFLEDFASWTQSLLTDSTCASNVIPRSDSN